MNRGRLHPPLAGCGVRLCSPPFAFCPRNRQPRQARPFVQSSCANRVGACVGHRRPLEGSRYWFVSILEWTHICSRYILDPKLRKRTSIVGLHSLGVCKCLDVEPKSGTDAVDVFAVELLHDRRFARIVQATIGGCFNRNTMVDRGTYRNRMRISLSFRRFLRMMVSRPIARMLT